jgi:hypothetical protein
MTTGPTALAVGTTGLWVATQARRDDPAYLHRYTRTGQWLKQIEIADGVADMVHGAGAMWLAVEDRGALRRYGASGGGRFWASLPSRGTDLSFGRGWIWALSEAETLTRVGSDSPRRRFAPLPGTPRKVDVSGRFAIVTLPTLNKVFVTDTRTMKPAAGPAVDVAGYPYGIASRGRDVYVTAQDADALVHLKR